VTRGRLKTDRLDVDKTLVADGVLDAGALDGVLVAWLHSQPEATVAALAEDGAMVALPPVDQFRDFAVVRVPAEPTYFLSLEKLFRRLTESRPVGLFLVHTDRTLG
jgi:hypothetical protein